LTEKLVREDRDEHNQADILTSGFDLAPAFPARSLLLSGTVA